MTTPFAWCFAPYNDAALAAFNEKWGSYLKLTCYACPVQIHGLLADGTWLYFRERGGEWEVNIGLTGDEAVYGKQLASGEHDGVPGGMSIFQVLGVIDAALEMARRIDALEARAGGGHD